MREQQLFGVYFNDGLIAAFSSHEAAKMTKEGLEANLKAELEIKLTMCREKIDDT